jgi:hypothetical protein
METTRTEPGEVTMAEAIGLTEELGGAIAGIAEGELAAGRTEEARTILEGLVVTNPRDARGWILLSRTHRALGQPLAARFCAEVAAILAPEAPAAPRGRARRPSGRPRCGPRPAPDLGVVVPATRRREDGAGHHVPPAASLGRCPPLVVKSPRDERLGRPRLGRGRS